MVGLDAYDVVGVNFRPHAQIGKTFAEIVDGDLVAKVAQLRCRLMNARKVVDVLILSDFDDHSIRMQTQSGEQVFRVAVEKFLILETVGACVDE